MKRSDEDVSLEERKAEMYGGLLDFLLPPYPMTAAEFVDWWKTERAPILETGSVTGEQAMDALTQYARALREIPGCWDVPIVVEDREGGD
jgi:hypothetical protein